MISAELPGWETDLGKGDCHENGADSVVQRTFSALILGELGEADPWGAYLTADQLRGWRDTAVQWFVAERDLRGLAPGLGWATRWLA